jgi:hypothetical protein
VITERENLVYYEKFRRASIPGRRVSSAPPSALLFGEESKLEKKKKRKYVARFEVFTAVTMKNAVV